MPYFYEKYKLIEKKIFNNNKFKLRKKQISELKKDFKFSNILISGACGSIGYILSKKILNFNFKKIYLLDKNENDLTELNRQFNSYFSKDKIKKITYVCSDLTQFDISKFLKINKISHYLNLAAIKHVRSEEEINSIKYMFKTNSDLFLPSKKNKYIKKIFSVSTDKSVNPTSILGVSKLLMEKKLLNFKLLNKDVFVSSARFANVSFSNGSILKHAADKLDQKEYFGIPKNIKRFFITHEESCNLCLHALLSKNDNKIIIPSEKALGKQFLISDIVKQIAKYKEINVKFLDVSRIKKYRNNVVYLTKSNFSGQKILEELLYKHEIILKNDCNEIMSINFQDNIPINRILKKIYSLNSIMAIKDYLEKEIKFYKKNNNFKRLTLSI